MATITAHPASPPKISAAPRKSARPHPTIFRGLRRARILTHAVLLLIGVVWVYPFLWALGTSFKSTRSFFQDGLGIWPSQIRTANYIDAWNTANFGQYFLNTVFTTVMTVVFVALFTSMSGYVLARVAFPGKRIVIGLVAVTLFLPHGYTILPVFDLIQRLGLLNTLWAIIVVQVSSGMIFNTLLFAGYYTTIDRELEESARIDGANFNQTFLLVMFPLALPMLATVALLTFINSWNSYFIPLVFTIGQPDLRTLPVGLFAFTSEHSTDWTLLCAGSVIALVPIILVFVLLQRYFVSAIAGAIKG